AEIPVPSALALHRRVQKLYDAEAAATPDQSAQAVELSQALALIWAEPNAEARWEAGEDVFATCRTQDISATPVPSFA
ncbi:MAG: hypothetical protein AAF568_04715, partial [Pseudomonadota bacterium]